MVDLKVDGQAKADAGFILVLFFLFLGGQAANFRVELLFQSLCSTLELVENQVVKEVDDPSVGQGRVDAHRRVGVVTLGIIDRFGCQPDVGAGGQDAAPADRRFGQRAGESEVERSGAQPVDAGIGLDRLRVRAATDRVDLNIPARGRQVAVEHEVLVGQVPHGDDQPGGETEFLDRHHREGVRLACRGVDAERPGGHEGRSLDQRPTVRAVGGDRDARQERGAAEADGRPCMGLDVDAAARL